MNRHVPIDFSQHSVVLREIDIQPSSFGISLFAYIDEQDLAQQRIALIREVAFYVTVTIVLFFVLAFYLSNHIAAPIQLLRQRIKAMEQGQLTSPPSIRRYDEIGSLYNAFNKMTGTLKNKEAQLLKLANHDELTGILNRRALLEQARQLRYSDSMTAVCVMDLDHFKSINDKFGHAVGDEALLRFCQLVTKELGPGHVFGRLGGEEFALLLPDMDVSLATKFTERIRMLTEQSLYLSLPANAGRLVTVSIGITIWTHGDINKALAAADHCLYQAKHMGRNKVVAC
ncbi:GGDEF domain-containing protein [Vibrio sonorensis]|uniref:GGDEF domain-containing protein n=1 Tax=Vibrio sonorensis TaxID=1004316 RepID=UPI0009FC4765|nr:sensor domain-containing diguanylate cyclase [Vibrio sonorensis]